MDAPMHTVPVPSPCVEVCQLDAEQVCLGCHRHLSEIAEWTGASTGRRLEIRWAAQRRAAAAGNMECAPPLSAKDESGDNENAE